MAELEWDPTKAASNCAKHGVHFADAVGVFNDDFAITIEDTSTNEERFKTLGMDFPWANPGRRLHLSRRQYPADLCA